LEKYVDVSNNASTLVELNQNQNQNQNHQLDVLLVSMLKEEDVLEKEDQLQKENAKKDLSKEEKNVSNKLFTITLYAQKDTSRKENFASNQKLHAKEFVLLELDVEEDVQETTNANHVVCLNSLLT